MTRKTQGSAQQTGIQTATDRGTAFGSPFVPLVVLMTMQQPISLDLFGLRDFAH